MPRYRTSLYLDAESQEEADFIMEELFKACGPEAEELARQHRIEAAGWDEVDSISI